MDLAIALASPVANSFESTIASFDDVTLEKQLCSLAGNINAASYRFVMLIAECDRRRLWAQQGMASCAVWLGWVCA